jgi:hypothetical protein
LNNPINLTDPDGRSAEPVIDEKNKTITVNIKIVFYGSGASQENVDAAIASINGMWNANANKEGWSDAGDGWRMKVNAEGIATNEEGAQEMEKENEGNSLYNYVRVENQNNSGGPVDENGKTDHKVSYMLQAENSGFWITGQMKSTTPAHEMGHGLNLNHDDGGIMVPGISNRKVTTDNLSQLRNRIDQFGTDKSGLIDKYWSGVKRMNYGSTATQLYDKNGYPKPK